VAQAFQSLRLIFLQLRSAALPVGQMHINSVMSQFNSKLSVTADLRGSRHAKARASHS
jgi:hypothetical protein